MIQIRNLEDQLWNTNIINTNVDQQDQTLMLDNANIEIANDDYDDSEQTLTNADAIPDKIESTSLELPTEIADLGRDRDRDQEQQQNIDEKPVSEQQKQMISITNQFSDVKQICGDIDDQCQISQAGADIVINESVLPQSPSLESQSTLKSSNVIYISGEQITVADSKKAKDASVAAQLKKNCREIRMPDILLEDKHIDTFIGMVRSVSHWDMVTVLAMQKIDHYERKPEEVQLDDIQLLYEGEVGPNNVGHYICIHYRANERKIYVYDSQYRRRISDNSRAIIDRRFSKLTVNFVEPRTKQPDYVSCGVFAIAYATTILLGQDPAEYPLLLGNGLKKYKTVLLRDHLAKMIEENKLSLFPRPAAAERMEIVQNMNVRVLIERLKITQDGGHQVKGCSDELNVLQHKATAIVSDDAHEKFVENGKRKINNADGNLEKKTKSKDAVDTANSTKSLTCNICGYISKNKSYLPVHMRKHNGKRPYGCKFCKKWFTRNYHLKCHMKTHRKLFPFQCSNCRQGFPHKKQWELHESLCTIRRFECYLCKMDYRQKRDLGDHMTKHRGENPYCSICQKKFSSKEACRKHMERHEKLFRFHCSKCRRGFENEEPYKLHENLCEVKCYACQLCKRIFYGHVTNLLTHMRREHSDGKSLSCNKSDCKELFKTNLKLNQHMKHCPNKDK